MADPNNAANNRALNEQVLNGAFAFVMTSAGAVYILNIDPELRMTAQVRRKVPDDLTVPFEADPNGYAESPKPLTHSLRDQNVVTFSAALGPQNGPARLDTPPPDLVDSPHLMSFPTKETRINARVIPPQTGASFYEEKTYVYFPNRATVRAQDWVIGWEGDLTGVRITGDIQEDLPAEGAPVPLATTISDNGSGFCGLGVDGDVLTLVGCEADADCPTNHVCVRSATAPLTTVDGRAITGMCMSQDIAAHLRDDDPQCRRMLETFRRYEIVKSTDGATTVVPKRDEVPRPMFLDANGDRVACDEKAEQHTPTSCQPEMSNLHQAFSCVVLTARPDGSPSGLPLGPNDLKKRCLQRCGKPGPTDPAEDQECRAGRVCENMPPDGKFCVEGAPIAQRCGLEELFSYKIGAGNAFVVSGSASGRTESIRKEAGPNGPRCVINDLVEDKTLIGRIPLNIDRCSAESTPQLSPDPAMPMPMAMKVLTDTSFARADAPSPNPCLFVNPLDGSRIAALFQNTEIRFVLTDLQAPIAGISDIRFSVHGGVSAQTVFPSIDATPGLPARLLLGPIPQPNQLDVLDPDPMNNPIPKVEGQMGLFSDLPYLFIVDQRQFSGGRLGVRGQIIRITPRIAETSPLVGFEGFQAGGRYFPIQ